MELRLISQRVPFMTLVALPTGKQRCIHGPAVNVPSKLDTVCTVLPRLPSQSELVPLKFKRKMCYKGYYMFAYVTPENMLNALRWLKANNPLYADVEINAEWLDQSLDNDSDLCTGLVQTEPEVSDELADSSSTTASPSQPCDKPETASTEAPASVAVHVENNVDSDEIATAYGALTAAAEELGFSIHEVPRDGNCLFSAIASQLDSLGVQDVDAHTLRKMVVSYLRENPFVDGTHYSTFLPEPVASDNAYTADTEAPTAEDAHIAAIADPVVRAQQRWERYLHRLSEGAWGDNIAIQGVCNMLNITVHVLSSQNPSSVSITPVGGASQNNVYLGLIMQYHYVGLDKLPVLEQTSQATESSTDPTSVTECLDDATIDEHTRQITGGPSGSMLTVENPEAKVQQFSIAPAEGQKPMNIMTDANFEAMSNPAKFCFG